MWTSSIVKVQITTDPRAGLGHGLVGVEVDLFVFDRPPKPFDEDIVPPRALAVHRDRNLSFLQHRREVDGCELRSLVGVEYVRLSIASQRFLDRFDTEVRLHRDR